MKHIPKPMVLIILDGWGYRESSEHNPIKLATTPHIDKLFSQYPWTLLEASGKAVGLPVGQIGNSEVGHLHIGAGRPVPQDLTRINDAVEDGSFKKNPHFLAAIAAAKKNDATIHILGLVSPGGVHSQENQIQTLIQLLVEQGVKKHYLHAFLDGRDVPPQSAKPSLEKIEKLYRESGSGQIASIIGRYFAMDRDHRWDRTEKAYNLLTLGEAPYTAVTAVAGLEAAYARKEKDEFVQATTIHAADANPITLNDGDIIIFMNFRADRARQLSYAFTDPNFSSFKRKVTPKLNQYITLTQYASDLNAIVAYSPLSLKNTLGEYLSSQGLTQLRLAETEKYAHVTYFLNGGNEMPFPNESRHLIPSPKVPTYDLKPEMSAVELTDSFVEAIVSQSYDVIICNYANPDMIGHTGIETAAIKAVEVIDSCLGRIMEALEKVDGEALITADHGNIEEIYNEDIHQAHTAHTVNKVPLIYFGRAAKWLPVQNPNLQDVAPTLLYLIDLKEPQEMTGKNLLKLL